MSPPTLSLDPYLSPTKPERKRTNADNGTNSLFMIIILCGAIHYFLKARRAAKADYHAVEGGARDSKGRDSEEGVVVIETVEPDKQDTTYYGARAQLADPLPPFEDRTKEQRQTS